LLQIFGQRTVLLILMALLWFCFSVQHRSSSSDIEISVYPDTKSDFHYRKLSTDRPGGQPISDVEELRRPIRPHYAKFECTTHEY